MYGLGGHVLWAAVRFLHVIAAVFWVGGQLMLSVIVLPLLRRNADPGLTRTVAVAAGRRFGIVSTAGLLPVLLVTGIALAWHQGVRLTTLSSTTYGQVLSAKMALVFVVFVLAGTHGIVARKLPRSAGRVLAITTLALSVVIVALATVLASLG